MRPFAPSGFAAVYFAGIDDDWDAMIENNGCTIGRREAGRAGLGEPSRQNQTRVVFSLLRNLQVVLALPRKPYTDSPGTCSYRHGLRVKPLAQIPIAKGFKSPSVGDSVRVSLREGDTHSLRNCCKQPSAFSFIVSDSTNGGAATAAGT